MKKLISITAIILALAVVFACAGCFSPANSGSSSPKTPPEGSDAVRKNTTPDPYAVKDKDILLDDSKYSVKSLVPSDFPLTIIKEDCDENGFFVFAVLDDVTLTAASDQNAGEAWTIYVLSEQYSGEMGDFASGNVPVVTAVGEAFKVQKGQFVYVRVPDTPSDAMFTQTSPLTLSIAEG